MIDELERLAKLWQIGALTDEEFAEGKQRLLAPPAGANVAPRPVAADDTDLSPANSPEPDAPQTQATQPAAEDDLLFDDLNAMLEDGLADMPPLDDAATAEVAPVAAPSPDEATAPAADDDLLFDDLNAMLDDGLADLPALDEAATAEVAPVAAPSPDEITQPAADDDMLFDDLNAMLEDGLADLPPLDDAPPAEVAPVAAPSPDEVTQPAADDDMLFDDLNAMLDEGMADLPPLDDSTAADFVPPPSTPTVDDDAMFDDLNAMLAEGMADLPALNDTSAGAATPVAAPIQGETSALAAGDDLLFDDLNAMLDDGMADLPPLDDTSMAGAVSPAAAPPEGDSTLVAHAERLADDLDMAFEVAVPAAAPTEDLAAASDVPPEDEALGAAPTPAIDPEPATEAQSKPKRARRKFALGRIIVARGKVIALRLAERGEKLPRPVLLGIGGGALFVVAMGIGIALALVTSSSEPNAAETTTVEGHEPAEHAGAAGGHGDESAPDPSSPGQDAAEPQLAHDADEVMRQCPAINAMSEPFGTALAEQRKVPIQSLRVIERSGHVRTDARAPALKSCLVAFEMKTGPRQCKVDAVVRFDDGDVGAHLGENPRIVCEGDPGFERNHKPVTSAEAEH